MIVLVFSVLNYESQEFLLLFVPPIMIGSYMVVGRLVWLLRRPTADGESSTGA
jgi:hypothetical protein